VNDGALLWPTNLKRMQNNSGPLELAFKFGVQF
jgi:hypothetical protein